MATTVKIIEQRRRRKFLAISQRIHSRRAESIMMRRNEIQTKANMKMPTRIWVLYRGGKRNNQSIDRRDKHTYLGNMISSRMPSNQSTIIEHASAIKKLRSFSS